MGTMGIKANQRGDGDERILIFAPFGRDAQVISDVLAEIGACVICPSVSELCAEIAAGAGTAIIAVDAIIFDDLDKLARVLTAQPAWSDFPLIVLFHEREAAAAQMLLQSGLAKVGNLNLLERPLNINALKNAVTLALRARRRQYQTKAQMQQLEEAKEHLAQARNEAERANEAKSRFLAAASHDLRQPFQAMCLFHQIVADALHGMPASKAAKALGDAIASGEDLLNSLLDLSTLEAGVTKVEIADVPICEILDTVANDLGAIASDKGLALRVRSCSAVIRSDPVLLKRIIRNLTINAIRYTERGSVLIGCRIRHPHHLLVEVWDTGIGISSDKMSQIFEDFYQINNVERDRAKGIGLGLSIVDRMARMLGHEVSVRSLPGRGSVFSVKVEQSSSG